jgi:hypothetical protein
MSDQKPTGYMPILGTPFAVRMDLLNEEQAQANHWQSLTRLRERGGLSLCEAAAIAERRRWREQKVSEVAEAIARVESSSRAHSPRTLDLDASSRTFVRAHVEAERAQWSALVKKRDEYEITSIKHLAGEIVLRRVNGGEVPQQLESGSLIALEVLRYG